MKFLIHLRYFLVILFAFSNCVYAGMLPKNLWHSPLLYQMNSIAPGTGKAVQTPLTYASSVIDPATNQVV